MLFIYKKMCATWCWYWIQVAEVFCHFRRELYQYLCVFAVCNLPVVIQMWRNKRLFHGMHTFVMIKYAIANSSAVLLPQPEKWRNHFGHGMDNTKRAISYLWYANIKCNAQGACSWWVKNYGEANFWSPFKRFLFNLANKIDLTQALAIKINRLFYI